MGRAFNAFVLVTGRRGAFGEKGSFLQRAKVDQGDINLRFLKEKGAEKLGMGMN